MMFNNKNVTISPLANIGTNVKIGDNVTIFENVEIADNSVIGHDCIIGEPAHDYYGNDNYQNPTTKIGENALIRSHSIIYSGCDISNNFSTGHRVTIRENTTIGKHCSIGTLSDLQGDIEIGNYCRLHSNVHLAQGSKLGDYVFLYPYTVMTNDPFPPSEQIKGATVGDFSQIAVHAVILPGIKIGKHCLIGANSLVSKNLPDYSMASGSPAKVERDVRDIRALGIGHPYPWPYRFKRGMPWEDLGFEKWIELTNPDAGDKMS